MIESSKLSTIANGMRAFCIAANRHPGGSLSSVETLSALFYSGVSTHLDSDPALRDRFIQSKGHAASPLMFDLWATNRVSASLSEILAYGELDSPHPRMP